MDKQLEDRISKLANDFAADLTKLMKENTEPMYFSFYAFTRKINLEDNSKYDSFGFWFHQNDEPFHNENKVNDYD